MESENPQSKAEDKRVEYTALRAEIVQADNTCLLMTGFIIAAVGALYGATKNLEWLASLLSLIGLFYYTEKRFSIRHIANFIRKEVSTKESGFGWEEYVARLRENEELRPSMFLRPYNAEVIFCILVAFSPLPGYISNPIQIGLTHVFWFLFAFVTLILGSFNAFCAYPKLGAKPKDGWLSGICNGITDFLAWLKKLASLNHFTKIKNLLPRENKDPKKIKVNLRRKISTG